MGKPRYICAMCGRYTLSLPIAVVAEELGVDHPEFEVEPRYNVAPTQYMPVVMQAPAGASMQRMRWGLVPGWAKDLTVGAKMINARAETLTEKPAFRQALAQRRCLVPADGFYEWQATPLGKRPTHIHLRSRGLLTFAGLWEAWHDGEGRPIHTFTIITTSPNALMAPIHDRMPVIVQPADRATWLSPQSAPQALEALLAPLPDGLLAAQQVCDLVGNARNEGPQLLDPPQTLF